MKKSDAVEVIAYQGNDARQFVNEIAALRIEVFREFPYLYEGNLDYEHQYLETYFKSPRSVVILVREANRVVGASTGIHLEDEEIKLKGAFTGSDFDPRYGFYYGESVLLRPWRGQGIGKTFFELREAAAKKHQCRFATFCSVVRPSNHPLRPADYMPLDSFWQAQGFHLITGLTTHYSWQDVHDVKETSKLMQYWVKAFDRSAKSADQP